MDSERINSLSAEAEVFFVRLMLKADDFGRYDARASVLLATLYPLRVAGMNTAQVGKWLGEIERAGLVKRYEVEGKPYLVVRNFQQRTRAATSKYPPPPGHLKLCDGRVSDTISGEIPTLDEVKAYAATLGIAESVAVAFWDHFEARGWVDRYLHQIASWQAKLRRWQAEDTRRGAEAAGTTRKPTMSDLRAVLALKQERATGLKAKHTTEHPLGVTWGDPGKREEYQGLMREVKELKTKIEGMV